MQRVWGFSALGLSGHRSPLLPPAFAGVGRSCCTCSICTCMCPCVAGRTGSAGARGLAGDGNAIQGLNLETASRQLLFLTHTWAQRCVRGGGGGRCMGAGAALRLRALCPLGVALGPHAVLYFYPPGPLRPGPHPFPPTHRPPTGADSERKQKLLGVLGGQGKSSRTKRVILNLT